ncbi:unnamed protein product [Cuscuta campestris]|uniref:Formin-like protein n=1 Tax=Cuscuta campestris TaxID=132261 RepID=A0A484M3F2_9ASTE|nr:unnamed protein product [Cuscuta campestris]
MTMARFVVLLVVVFLTALVSIDSGWKLSGGHLGHLDVQKTDKHSAEQVWILCMKQLQENPKEGSHFRHPSEGSHSSVRTHKTLSAKRTLWEVKEKQIPLGCILDENPSLHDELDSLFIKYKDFTPRRSLRHKKKNKRVSLRTSAPSPVPSSHPAHVGSHHSPSQSKQVLKPHSQSATQNLPLDKLSRPFFVSLHTSPHKPPNHLLQLQIVTPDLSNALPKSPNDLPKSPNDLPKPPSALPKPPNAPKTPSAPKPPNAPKPPSAPKPPNALKPPSAPKPPSAQKPPSAPKPPNAPKPPSAPKPFSPPKPPSAPGKPKNATPENNDDRRTFRIAAIAGSTMAAFAFVALFLICCLKKREDNGGQRDGRPLLKNSTGSSQNTQSISSSSNKDSQTSLNVSNLSGGNSSSGTKTMGHEATVNLQALPLPPGKSAPPPPSPSPPVPPPPKPPAPKAPPPPKARLPPNPPKPGAPKSSPLGPHRRGQSSGSEGSETGGGSPKTKLKPFFWDKVNASPDHSMVWHDIKAGSFQFNEEMMESLFGYSPAEQNKNERKKDSSLSSTLQYIQIIEAKKAQNLAILLKALNVTTEEVCDALREGNELPPELIQTLLKMAPTSDEELKLRLYAGEISQLGPADRFLKTIIEIPFAFKRMESLLFMINLQEEVSSVKESFATLEVACNELKSSRLFLKLLEAVLKTGNRMNNGTYRGGAQAFKLDTLLKLSDVKGTDGKTTLLHFVVQEIIRSEGIRAARRLRESHSMSSVKTEDLVEDSQHESREYYRTLGLQAVSGLSDELKNVKRAAVIDGDSLTQSVSKLGHSLLKAKEFLNNEMMSSEDDSGFSETLTNFLEHAEGEIPMLLNEEQKIMALVKSTGDYFHGSSGKDEGLRLFVIVRDFLIMLDKVCNEVEKTAKSKVKVPAKELTSSTSTTRSQDSQTDPLPDVVRQHLFPAITSRKIDDDFSSDEESSSP